mmetsp:Transcript_43851/g.93256  ORF Transcript_43851/g.93256 Transcript_43851/m.93256 type:complete len:124 (+) Transcript_43851:32-403(+)
MKLPKVPSRALLLTLVMLMGAIIAGVAGEETGGLCPNDHAIPAECLEAVTPPFPFSKKGTAREWVEKAIDSATRCCADESGGHIDGCRCPVWNWRGFRSKMLEYCDAVENHCRGVMLGNAGEC